LHDVTLEEFQGIAHIQVCFYHSQFASAAGTVYVDQFPLASAVMLCQIYATSGLTQSTTSSGAQQ
jgi:hypothetical protein